MNIKQAMRKIILDVAVSLDGFIEGPNGEIDWITADEVTDFGDVLTDILDGIDVIFYGRISYELWGNYQPPAAASPKLKAAYELLHSKTKYVFSTTEKFEAENTFTIQSGIKEKVAEIVRQPGGNIWLYGGGKLTTTLINLGLLDVYRLAVYPVILGEGKPLFNDIRQRVALKPPKATVSKAGLVMLNYEAEKG